MSLLLVGLAVRLHGLDREPLTFHPTRQYRSALIARAIYLDRTRPAADRERILADKAAEAEGILEPTVMEHVTAVAYLMTGGERLWVPRLLSSLFWLAGGVSLWYLLRRMAGTLATGAGLAVYLLLPLGVEGGRSFQPDSLTVAMMLFSILALVRYSETPRMARLLIAAGLSAFALFLKPVVAPVILAAFVGLQIHGRGWKALLNRHSLIYVTSTMLPMAAFYVYGVFIAGFLRGQADSSFIPELLTRGSFYSAWITIVDHAIGLPLVALAFGATLLLSGTSRWLMASMWTGYVLFGIAFNYRTATHTYYHLQLIPIVALGMGVVVDRIVKKLDVGASGVGRWAARTGLGMLLTVLLAGAIKVTPTSSLEDQISVDAHRRIGELVGHSAAVLALSDAYGKDLEYHGRVVVSAYPTADDLALLELQGLQADSISAILNTPILGRKPEWFAVTSWRLWRADSRLRGYLETTYPVAGVGSGWIVFDVRNGPHPPAATDKAASSGRLKR